MRNISSCLLAAALLVGCTPSLQEERAAEGAFHDLEVATVDGSSYAIALREGGGLSVIDLATHARCDVDGVQAYTVGTSPEGQLALVTSSDEAPGCTTVGFVGSDCQPLMAPLACTGRPARVQGSIFGGSWRRHLAIETDDGTLWLADPWGGDSVKVGAEVHAWRAAGPASLWLHDGDRLLLQPLGEAAVAPIATGVKEVALTPDRAALYADGEGLWHVEAGAPTPRRLADDACNARAMLDGRVAYLSPCAERRLVVHDLQADSISEVGTGVGAFRADMVPVFFTLGDATASRVGELFAAGQTKPIHVAADASLDSVRRVTEGGVLAHLLLAGGSLLRFDGSGSTVVAEHVEAFAVRHDHLAILTGGALQLRPEGGGGWKSLAVGVPADRFAFASQLEAIAYLKDWDGQTGTFALYVLPTGDRLVVAGGVSELAEVRSDTTPGVAYIVAGGAQAGIWFATPP